VTPGESASAPVTGYQWEASDASIAAAYGLDAAQIVRFDTNTSPRRPSALPAWLERASAAPLNEYPDATYAALVDAVCALTGAGPDSIVVGAGADELLDIAAKVFLGPGDAAVAPTPTYAMYGVVTAQRGARLVKVPRRPASEGFGLDPGALLSAAADAKLAWLCDPNNPTGTAEAPAVLEAVLRGLAAMPGGGPVVVADEAYREFAGASLIASRARFPHLVVIRTLSKAYALAGIRVGYAVAGPDLAARMNAVRPPGSISTLSAAIATAALREPERAAGTVAATVLERERFRDALLAAGWNVPPSVTNFLLLETDGPDAADETARRLTARGLVPRRFGGGELRAWLRLTVRTRDEDDRLLDALGRRAVR
jgi:histidinol-phosphate aminotransferase